MGLSILGALLPVMLVVAIGWAVSRHGWVTQSSVKDISNLVFFVLLPALLFRTMANVSVSELNFAPVGIYFLAAFIVFGGTLAVYGFRTKAAARGLAHAFSNLVMVGVPIVSLFYGEQGLVPLFTLVTVHALVLMSSATVVFELASAYEATGRAGRKPVWRRGKFRATKPTAEQGEAASSPDAGDPPHRLVSTAWQAVRNSLLHPVPIPILAGILVAYTGSQLPDVIDRTLQVLGTAMGPMALLLVGMTLGYARIGRTWRGALRTALVKCLLLPFVFFCCAFVLGARGPSIQVLLLCAGLPIGANVMLFTLRYGVAQEEVTASMALSTVVALFCIPLVVLVLSPLLA